MVRQAFIQEIINYTGDSVKNKSCVENSLIMYFGNTIYSTVVVLWFSSVIKIERLEIN